MRTKTGFSPKTGVATLIFITSPLYSTIPFFLSRSCSLQASSTNSSILQTICHHMQELPVWITDWLTCVQVNALLASQSSQQEIWRRRVSLCQKNWETPLCYTLPWVPVRFRRRWKDFQLQQYTPSRTAQRFPAAAMTMLVALHRNTGNYNSTSFCSRMSWHTWP